MLVRKCAVQLTPCQEKSIYFKMLTAYCVRRRYSLRCILARKWRRWIRRTARGHVMIIFLVDSAMIITWITYELEKMCRQMQQMISWWCRHFCWLAHAGNGSYYWANNVRRHGSIQRKSTWPIQIEIQKVVISKLFFKKVKALYVARTSHPTLSSRRLYIPVEIYLNFEHEFMFIQPFSSVYLTECYRTQPYVIF